VEKRDISSTCLFASVRLLNRREIVDNSICLWKALNILRFFGLQVEMLEYAIFILLLMYLDRRK
jgi:hypothetical protein